MTPPEAVFGQPNLTMCGFGSLMNQLNRPRGVAVDANGTVWISDTNNQRMLKFLNGQFLGNQPTADGLLGVTGSLGSLDLIVGWVVDGRTPHTRRDASSSQTHTTQDARRTSSSGPNSWRWTW